MIKNNYIKPDCSIVVLNYFGEKVIKQTINSLLQLNFPKNKLEIIIVDNNSLDKSKQIINKLVKEHPKLIKKIYLKKNMGFAKGNNCGIRISKGAFVALLNNDCIVDKNWLKELLKKAKSNDKIFSVGSKILLYPKYVDLYFPVIDGLCLQKVSINKSKLIEFSNENKISIPFTFLTTSYLIELPTIIKNDSKIELILFFLNSNKLSLNDIDNIYSKSFKILKIKKLNHNMVFLNCVIEKNKTKKYYDKIQNAGSIVFQDGYGRDIGATVKYQIQNYEKDNGQFNKDKEVYSTCGAAVLYSKKILKKIGLLDESFFMYYEDTEISEKARILGYKNFYCHKAVVRHLHALSSKEWSPFFIFNVEKGRLLHVYYTFPRRIFIKEFIKFAIKSHYKFLRSILNKKERANSWQNIKVLFDFFINYLKYRRNKIVKKLNLSNVDYNHNLILKGYWYFN